MHLKPFFISFNFLFLKHVIWDRAFFAVEQWAKKHPWDEDAGYKKKTSTGLKKQKN